MDDCFPKSKFHTPPTPPAGKEFSVTVTMCVCVCVTMQCTSFYFPSPPVMCDRGGKKSVHACLQARPLQSISLCVCVCVCFSLSPSRANQLGHD